MPKQVEFSPDASPGSTHELREREHDALVAAVTEHRAALRSIRVHYRAGTQIGSWSRDPLCVVTYFSVRELQEAAGEVQKDEDGVSDETPEQIAEEIEALCTQHAENQKRPHVYHLRLHDDAGKRLAATTLTIGASETAVDAETGERLGLVAIQNRSLDAMHKNYIGLMKETTELVKGIAQSPFVAAAVTKAEKDAEIEIAKVEAAIEVERTRQYGGALAKLADHVGPKLGNVAEHVASKMASKMAENEAQSKTPAQDRIACVLGKLTQDQRASVEIIIGNDAWDLVQACTRATNDELANIVDALKPKITMAKALAVGQSLGPELTSELVGALKMAGAL